MDYGCDAVSKVGRAEPRSALNQLSQSRLSRRGNSSIKARSAHYRLSLSLLGCEALIGAILCLVVALQQAATTERAGAKAALTLPPASISICVSIWRWLFGAKTSLWSDLIVCPSAE